jgi:F-type H+-transporting ATPase subunit delta
MPQAVATRYARALADSALDPKNRVEGRQVLTELATFEQMMKDSADLRNILLSPAVQSSRKRAVIGKFSEVLPLSRLVRNFLYVTVDHHRIGIIGEIREAFEAVLDERLGVVRAEVKSAMPLDAGQQHTVQAELSRVAGKQVRCTFDTDANLVGGVMARIGSTIYDGSVRARLDTLRERLVARR